ncbi:MAG: 4Fe-4S binding protein [Clostridia bacterium]|nr:4Fe-4S binding protein [Clostridia bacterium]
MDIVQELQDAGFARVIVLDGAECGVPDVGSLVLALWPYAAERTPMTGEAWVHPYYFASQAAYVAADNIARRHSGDGVIWREDIRLKPIFARLPGFAQGRNTISSLSGCGSRFHVQMLTVTPAMAPTHHLEAEEHPLRCGDCHLCERACPTNALEGGVFHRERCLRNWQVGGTVYPEEVRRQMGTRLIGCDECQRCCPHNPAPEGENAPMPVTLEEIMRSPKEAAVALRRHIGATVTMPNRLLMGACIIAGVTGRRDLIPHLWRHAGSPSAAVAEHAGWALMELGVRYIPPEEPEIP